MDDREFSYLQDVILEYAVNGRLKPVYQALGGDVDYDVLRSVHAAMNR